MNDDDMTLETLIQVREELSPDLDLELLRQCYAIQKKFQFNADRSISLSHMEKAIDTYVSGNVTELGVTE